MEQVLNGDSKKNWRCCFYQPRPKSRPVLDRTTVSLQHKDANAARVKTSENEMHKVKNALETAGV